MFGTLNKSIKSSSIRSLKTFAWNNADPMPVPSLIKKPTNLKGLLEKQKKNISKRLCKVSTVLEFEKYGIDIGSGKHQSQDLHKAHYAKELPKAVLPSHDFVINVPVHGDPLKVRQTKFSELAKEGRLKLSEALANGLISLYKPELENKTKSDVLQEVQFKASIRIRPTIAKTIQSYFPDGPPVAKVSHKNCQDKDFVKKYNKEGLFSIIGYLSNSENPEKLHALLDDKFVKPILEKVIKNNF
ncbi:hypothetical protein ACO0QE_001888 [Hanseniaspora vineae]